ncbi:restriction endonuclease subunit S [Pantoea allii]|uniref:restriction endonuclease subunit S n=1 Tax=Pantoea allii TaxID=574096 RepID=UPI003D318E04
MAKYKAYPDYKESGVEWLGEIPQSWDVTRLKYIASIYGRIGFRGYTVDDIVGEGEGAIVLSPSNIVDEKLSLEKKTFLRWEKYFESPEIIVKENDILLVKTGSTYGKSTIIMALSEPMTINPQMALIKKIVVEPRFLAYWFNTSLIKSKIEIVNTGSGMPTMTQENINNFPVLIPPNNFDVFIADFLDHETAKIDNLLEKQRQLIELLKEKRQAVISHAVTKGLNPDVPMKDSGVEWLGEVPEHWIVRRLKHTANLQSGIPKGKDLTGKNSISVPMLRVANVQDGYLDLEDVHAIDIEPSQLERYLLRDGDVLMNEGGDNDQLGRGAVWTASIDNCIHQNHVFAIRPQNIESDWLDMLTRAAYAKFHFYRVAKQSTNLASISSTNIKETPLLIPPVEERMEILKFIKLQLGRLKKSEELSVNQVALLQERRAALISAAVTGKIDVRDWVAPDTQDAEEPQEATA